MKSKINLPGFMSAMPENYSFSNYSNQVRNTDGENGITMQKLRASGPFNRGLLSTRTAFECSGSCPEGKILCKSDINCVCCSEGCVDIIGGGGVKCGTLD